MTLLRPGSPAKHRRSLALAGGTLISLALLVGCGGDEEPETTPAEALAAARTTLDETSGVRLGLTVDELPPGTSGLISAEGLATHDPAFEGSIKVAAGGITVDADVIAADGLVYAVLPFTTRYAEIEPADYGAPDPAALMSTEDGLSSLLTEVDQVAAGDQVRDGEDVLSTYTGTLAGDVVAGILPSADPAGSFDASFTLAEGDRLTQVVITGPFYPEAEDVTYTIDLDDYGTETDITAP